MALVKLFIDSNVALRTRLPQIPNDGNDYEITLAAGQYVVDTDIVLFHPAGGRIVLRAHAGGDVRIKGTPFYSRFNIVARDIDISGIHFGDDIPYYLPVAPLGCFVMFGGRRSTDNTFHCNPTSLSMSNCSINGAQSIGFAASQHSSVYTQIKITDIVIEEGGINGILAVFSSHPTSTEGFFHAYFDHITGEGKNGPDTTTWDPNGVAPFNGSTHCKGTAAIDLSHMDGVSSALITRFVYTSRIFGSANHDMHCLRVNHMKTAGVSITVRDSSLSGSYESGHMSLDGGGNPWLFYYHTGGSEYPLGKPQIIFENCTLSTYIASGVGEIPADWLGIESLVLCNQNSSCDLHFYDCTLSFDVPLLFRPYTCVSGVSATYTGTYLHSTTLVNVVNTLSAPTANRTLTIDTNSIPNPGLTHRRVPVLY